MPEPDEATIVAEEVYGWLAQWPFPEHPPDLLFIFRLVGLRVGSPTSREVYKRLADRCAIEREHQKRLHQTNGQPPRP